MKYIKVVSLVSLCAALGACASNSLSGHDLDYTSEATVPSLVVPEGVNNPVKEAYYPATAHSETRRQAQVSLLPPGSNLKRFDKKATK